MGLPLHVPEMTRRVDAKRPSRTTVFQGERCLANAPAPKSVLKPCGTSRNQLQSVIGQPASVAHQLPPVKRQPPSVGCQPSSVNRVLPPTTASHPESKKKKKRYLVPKGQGKPATGVAKGRHSVCPHYATAPGSSYQHIEFPYGTSAGTGVDTTGNVGPPPPPPGHKPKQLRTGLWPSAGRGGEDTEILVPFLAPPPSPSSRPKVDQKLVAVPAKSSWTFGFRHPSFQQFFFQEDCGSLVALRLHGTLHDQPHSFFFVPVAAVFPKDIPFFKFGFVLSLFDWLCGPLNRLRHLHR